MLDAVTFGQQEYGRMGIIEAYTRQDQLQVPYLSKQLLWDKTVANDVLVALDNIQLNSGYVCPILEVTTSRLDCVDPGQLMLPRNRLGEIEASLWIDEVWAQQLQAEGDVRIMEWISALPEITRDQLDKVITVRLVLQVIILTDYHTQMASILQTEC